MRSRIDHLNIIWDLLEALFKCPFTHSTVEYLITRSMISYIPCKHKPVHFTLTVNMTRSEVQLIICYYSTWCLSPYIPQPWSFQTISALKGHLCWCFPMHTWTSEDKYLIRINVRVMSVSSFLWYAICDHRVIQD
jgi:hypothetical protein